MDTLLLILDHDIIVTNKYPGPQNIVTECRISYISFSMKDQQDE